MTGETPVDIERAALDAYRKARADGLTAQGRVRAALAAAVPLIAAAERERLYAELGNEHYVIFKPDGWTTEHSVECRLSGRMSECDWHEAVARVADDGYEPEMAGRWKITDIDSEGLPSFERANDGRVGGASAP